MTLLAAEPQPTVHLLRTWPDHFGAIRDGRKRAELRRDDRGFRVGDLLDLREFRPTSFAPDEGARGRWHGEFTGQRLTVRVTHKLEGPRWGLEAGYAVLSIEPA